MNHMEPRQNLASYCRRPPRNTFTFNEFARTAPSLELSNLTSHLFNRLAPDKSGFQPNFFLVRELSLLSPVYSISMPNLETESPAPTSGYMKSMNFSLVQRVGFGVGFGVKSQYWQPNADFSRSESSGYKQVLARAN
jgi:hypothetical protein